MKRILAINDISGAGNNSLVANVAVATAFCNEVYPVPSSMFSVHTGFDKFTYLNNTKISEFFSDVEAANLSFDAISVGFLAGEAQADAVKEFLARQKQKGVFVLVDTVMADHGKFYAVFDQNYVEKMRALTPYADVITPNLTEACLLCGADFSAASSCQTMADVYALCSSFEGLFDMCPHVVITSVPCGEKLCNVVFDEGDVRVFSTDKVPTDFSGTGDLFSSVLLCQLLLGKSLFYAAEKAVGFIYDCVSANPNKEWRLGPDFCLQLKKLTKNAK